MFLFPWFLVSLCLGGEKPVPAPLPVQALANLKALRSFRYTLTFSRTEPPTVAGSFQGAVILPDTLEQTGAWADQPVFQVIARGNQEYLRTLPDTWGHDPNSSPNSGSCPLPGDTAWTVQSGKSGTVPAGGLSPDFPSDTGWTVQARGEEADFLIQLDRALARDSFSPLSGDPQNPEFSFAPNLPFLDPFLSKHLSGRIRLQKTKNQQLRTETLLPTEVVVTSSDKTVSWQVKLSDFNQVPPIHFPFAPQYRVLLQPAPAAPADTITLRRRLAAHGYDVRFALRGDSLSLYLERDLREDLLRMLTEPGKAEVWIGRKYLGTGPIPPEARKVPIQSDTSLTMILEQRFLTRPDIATTTLEESLGTTRVQLALNRDAEGRLSRLGKLEKSGMYLALTFDDGVVALARIVKQGKTNLLELTSALGVPHPSVLKTILDSPVLSTRFRLLARESLSTQH